MVVLCVGAICYMAFVNNLHVLHTPKMMDMLKCWTPHQGSNSLPLWNLMILGKYVPNYFVRCFHSQSKAIVNLIQQVVETVIWDPSPRISRYPWDHSLRNPQQEYVPLALTSVNMFEDLEITLYLQGQEVTFFNVILCKPLWFIRTLESKHIKSFFVYCAYFLLMYMLCDIK